MASIQGAGQAVLWPWTLPRDFIRQHVVQGSLLDFFASKHQQRYDLILSRYVFEQHSIDPWILLRSGAYWRQFKKKDFRDYDKTYPASIPNLQAVFKLAWKRLRPGGVMVSHLCKRKYSALDETFLKSLHPRTVVQQDLGKLSSIVTLTKAR